MQEFFSDVYKSWQKIQQEKLRKIKNRLDKETFAAIFERENVLDIGCGNGYLEKEFRKSKIIGVDTDLDMISKNVAVFPRILADGEKLPFKKWSFDSIVSMDAMHLVRNHDFLRVLKPGGFVLFSIFYNDYNYDERKEMLKGKVEQLRIIDEFDIMGKEKEYVLIAIKPTSRLQH